MPCEHKEFKAMVRVGRLSLEEGGPITHYQADINIECADCGLPFEFVGVPVGSSGYRPCSDFGALEMRAPITPQGTRPPDNILGFSVSNGAVERTLN